MTSKQRTFTRKEKRVGLTALAVAVVVVAAVVTPPDPISQLMLAVPMVLLYEISIWCVRLIELRKKKADEAEGLTA